MRTSNVRYLVKKGISSVWKNLIMSFASFSILLVSLFQVSVTVLVMMNVNIVMKNIENTNEIVIYLKDGITSEQRTKIRGILESNENLTDVCYLSKEEGLQHFKEDMGEYADLIEYLEENPMPETFLARVTDLSKMQLVVTAITSIDSVEQLKAPYEFATALVNIRDMFSIIVIGVLLVLIIVSVVVVSNTIRTSVFSRRNEITIMKYVGATDGFIKLPFFVEGVFIGIVAGLAAWGLVWFVYDSVFSLFSENGTLMDMFGFFDLIPFGKISPMALLINCAAGGFLGAMGTVISTGKYLKV